MKIQQRANTLTVLLEGEIDHHSAPSVRNAVDEAILSSATERIEMDFSGVSFMDSSGIGLIMGRYKLISARGGTLHVTGLKKRDRKIVEMSGLKNLIEIG